MDRKPEGVAPAAPSASAAGTGFPSPLETTDFLPEQDVPIDDIVLDELPPLDEEESNEFPF